MCCLLRSGGGFRFEGADAAPSTRFLSWLRGDQAATALERRELLSLATGDRGPRNLRLAVPQNVALDVDGQGFRTVTLFF